MNDIFLFDEYKNKVLTPTKAELEKIVGQDQQN